MSSPWSSRWCRTSLPTAGCGLTDPFNADSALRDAYSRRSRALADSGRVQLARFLAGHDIIVNCALQDTAALLTNLIDDDPSYQHRVPGYPTHRRGSRAQYCQ
jgi:hypothetical protein